MTLSTTLRERRAAIKAQLDALVSGAESRADKNFTPTETPPSTGCSDLRTADASIVDSEAGKAGEAGEARAAQTLRGR